MPPITVAHRPIIPPSLSRGLAKSGPRENGWAGKAVNQIIGNVVVIARVVIIGPQTPLAHCNIFIVLTINMIEAMFKISSSLVTP